VDQPPPGPRAAEFHRPAHAANSLHRGCHPGAEPISASSHGADIHTDIDPYPDLVDGKSRRSSGLDHTSPGPDANTGTPTDDNRLWRASDLYGFSPGNNDGK
jgi:hypothetical protein